MTSRPRRPPRARDRQRRPHDPRSAAARAPSGGRRRRLGAEHPRGADHAPRRGDRRAEAADQPFVGRGAAASRATPAWCGSPSWPTSGVLASTRARASCGIASHAAAAGPGRRRAERAVGGRAGRPTGRRCSPVRPRPATRIVRLQIPFPDGVSAITEGGGAAWVALSDRARARRDGRRNHAARLSRPADHPRTARAPVGEHAGRWLGGADRPAQPRRRARDRRRPAPGRDRGGPRSGVRGGQHTAPVAVLDPAARAPRAGQRCAWRSNPSAMAAGDGHVWVAGMARGTATRIDP